MSQHSRESPQEQIEESEVDLELQSSVEEVEETSITEPDEKVIKESMQEVDTDYAVVKPSADRASRKKIVEDEAEAKTAKETVQEVVNDHLVVKESQKKIDEDQVDGKTAEEATSPEDDYLSLDYEPGSESNRARAKSLEVGIYELPNVRPVEDVQGYESGKVAAVPSPANTLMKCVKEREDDEHYLSTEEIVSLPPSSGTIVKAKSNDSSVAFTHEENAEVHLKAVPSPTMRQKNTPSVQRPRSNVSADSVLKVKNTLVVRSDTMNYEERSRSSTLLKKRPTLEELAIKPSMQTNPYQTVMSPAIPTTPRPPPMAEQWMIEPTYSSFDEEAKDKRKCMTIQTIIIVCLAALIIIAVIAIAILGVNIQGFRDCEITANIIGTPLNPAMSCAEIVADGIVQDGVYDLRSDKNKYEAFCDLTTAGGGWTLVASVHENNLMRTCDCNDRWSSYETRGKQQFIEPCAWEDTNIFGHPVSATNTDYKGRGYFELNASDIMIWQVPNNVPLGMTKQRAAFRYRTNSGFLKSAGGNLRNFFRNTPLRPTDGIYIRSITTVLNRVASSIESLASLLTTQLYEHDIDRPNSILDYIFTEPGGHRIRYEHPGCSINVQYGANHRCYQSGLFVSSRKIIPLISLAGILNEDDLFPSLTVTITGTRVEPAKRSSYTDTITSVISPSYTLSYVAVNNQGSDNSTQIGYSDVFFIVSSSQIWNSDVPSQLTAVNNSPMLPNENGTYTITNSVTITGDHERFMFGTLLLAQEDLSRPSRKTVRDVLTGILEYIGAEGNLDISTQTNALVSPVVFDFASSAQLMTRLPPKMSSFATAGFVQFFTYGYSGYPTAFCPGIRTNSPHPEYVCIGGMSENPSEICTDFRGWGGLNTDPIFETRPSGFAHARNDIASTFMIFYR